MFRFAPGPRLLRRLRQRDGLKWGIPAMLLAVPYFLIAATCVQIIEGGGPGWLNLVVLWCLVLGMAFVLTGPISVLLLAKARVEEAAQVRKLRRQLDTQHTLVREPLEVA
ncbi:MAG: hypothetical protein ACK5H2_01860 [Beutenbergiaceae bacterium]